MQGLALPALAKEGGAPAFFRMVEAGMLDAPMFALWLSPDPVAEPAGEVHFGGHDRRRYHGVMHELPVVSTKFWTVAVTGVTVGERRLPMLGAEGAILDSGTSMITASDADAAAINQVRVRRGTRIQLSGVAARHRLRMCSSTTFPAAKA